MSNLRNEIVKLAYSKPHLRPHLLPLLVVKSAPRTASKLYLDNQTLDELVEMEAESLGMSAPRDAYATKEVKKVVGKYEAALEKEILAWLKKNGPAGTDPEEVTADLMDSSRGAANAPYLVMIWIMGHGRGPLDGDWDHVLDRKDQKGLVKYLENKLSKLVGETGDGPISEALTNAAFETGGESEGY